MKKLLYRLMSLGLKLKPPLEGRPARAGNPAPVGH